MSLNSNDIEFLPNVAGICEGFGLTDAGHTIRAAAREWAGGRMPSRHQFDVMVKATAQLEARRYDYSARRLTAIVEKLRGPELTPLANAFT